MVTTTAAYTDWRYRTLPGEGYDGVARISVAGVFGTGSLLFDGRAVLTAAHLFNERGRTASVLFETSAGTQTLSAARVLVHPQYDADNNNHDLALVWLSGSAPLQADRYGLYRNSDEIGKPFTLVGYGLTGSGNTGAMESAQSPWRLKAANQFDADIGTLKTSLGTIMGWSPKAGTQLVADFDNGTAAQNALGRLIGRGGTGQGLQEGLIAPGDSGGPAFVQGQLAGVASYTSSLGRLDIQPDIDQQLNSSFGEIAAWQRISAYQQWIDQSLRAQYTDAPRTPQEVQKEIMEGRSGTSIVYFLLQFTGQRIDPTQVLSVDYATRNGTATAGRDYVAASGTLKLYPGETQAVIPVEVIGDNVPEPNEYFYLDVFNPVGGIFPDNQVKLTAVRTIVDDDSAFW